jgi:hypothetical protein
MAEGKWVSYLRVSTGRQGRSGLGLDGQRAAVEDFLNGGKWKLVKEFVEVESGKHCARPVLDQALKACRLYGATLVIAKLDRLSRDAHFLLGLEKAGVHATFFLGDHGHDPDREAIGPRHVGADEIGKPWNNNCVNSSRRWLSSTGILLVPNASASHHATGLRNLRTALPFVTQAV